MVNVPSTSVNPFGEFRRESGTLLRDIIRRVFPDVTIQPITLDLPSNPQFGQLTSSICFEMAKPLQMSPLKAAEQIEKEAESEKESFPLIASIKAAGQGYVNFYANFSRFSSLALMSAKTFDAEYGFVKIDRLEKIIIEHTSANPNHPIHIGTSRNSVLGDSLARLLSVRGHKVSRHYYVDDVGRQSALIAYGYQLLGRPKPEGKPDHFIGAIYAVTSCLLEIRLLRDMLRKTESSFDTEEAQKFQRDLDDWISVAAELEDKYPLLFDHLLEKVSKAENPGLEINLLLQEYEAGKKETKQLIRELSQLCLEGFKQTMARAGIFIDSWDWESDFVWSKEVSRSLDALRRTPYVFQEGNVIELDAEKVARTLGLKEVFGLKETYEIPSLTLDRSDGTSLYTTRDIPYSIWKLKKANRVINVIGMEQNLAQLHLKMALCALGHVEAAKRLVHFAYNLINLPGYRVSARRGRYITFDEVMDEAVERAYAEVSKHSPDLPEEDKRGISGTVGVGAVKYTLVETDPQKPVVFTWDKVLDFERNSGPYVQYSHARACSILRKSSEERGKADFGLLKEPLERDLVLMVSRFPEVFIDAADNLKPHVIADFANVLADKFNTFYAALPVIKAETPELGKARLMLVDGFRITLRNALSLIGIEAPQRM